MGLSLQNFSTLVNNAIASAQSTCSSLRDFSVGSVARSLMEANATIALWQQYLALQVLSVTRLSSSFGDDVDSWLSQYGIERLGAVPATTTQTFISLSPGSSSSVVPVGSIVKTSDGKIIFSVSKDSSNQWWSETAGGYVRPMGMSSINCPVICTTAGASGNVMAGVINLLGTQISGIDTCTNLNSVTNGADQESDESVKNRVVKWFASLSSATQDAINSSVSGVSSKLTYQIIENDDGGNKRQGFFRVVIDDGSGDVSDSMLSTVAAAIDTERACGIEYAVLRADLVKVDVVIPVVLADGVTLDTVSLGVILAVTNYINDLSVGDSCNYTKLSSISLAAAGSLITSMGVITLNGIAKDISVATGQVIRAGNINLSLSS
ncbi:MAG: baseplate J/gp47 family protein [Acetobacter sp.]|jgi:uncharacterized phage protein gp47/JayE|nr:baseplate J/gp47 family protein [Acetobacter sp.]MCH4062065.1 baseplate J/gp47 family protein [Acetobacter sp.]MCH4089086.1 baseplate J/gp47 family protein [Acetobacter sp.]MCI1293188.1 baseplate J/gp47 family protein [Acetobacter sp.]MCI1320187.1 baseplate J/gp47 family protein [Acetobacter sp.]